MGQTAQSSKESKQDKSAQSHLGYRQSGQILEDNKTPERTICKQFTDCTRKEKRSGRRQPLAQSKGQNSDRLFVLNLFDRVHQ